MIPGMNQRQMQQAMKRMGVNQTEIDAIQVIFRLKDKDMVFEHPQVSKVSMMGQETFQVAGSYKIVPHSVKAEISEDDIKTVAEQAGVSHAVAKKAIAEADGDLAQAIMNLANQE